VASNNFRLAWGALLLGKSLVLVLLLVLFRCIFWLIDSATISAEKNKNRQKTVIKWVIAIHQIMTDQKPISRLMF
jgi:putative copper export protein